MPPKGSRKEIAQYCAEINGQLPEDERCLFVETFQVFDSSYQPPEPYNPPRFKQSLNCAACGTCVQSDADRENKHVNPSNVLSHFQREGKNGAPTAHQTDKQKGIPA